MRNIRKRGRIHFILMIVATAAVGRAQTQTYAIRLSPPFQTGENYHFTTTVQRVEKTTFGDHVGRNNDYEIYFEGKAHVIEVDQRSTPIKIAFTVDKFTKVEAGVTSKLLEAGTVVVSDGKKDQPVSLQEGAMEDSIRDAFHLAYVAHKPNDVTDDDIFGAKEPKRVGETWSLNRSLAAQSLKGNGVVVPQDGVSGTVFFEAKEKIGTADCLRLRGEMTVNGITPTNLPESFTVDDGSLAATFRGCLPLAGQGLDRNGTSELHIEIHASQAGTKLTVLLSEKRDVTWTLSAR